MKRTETYQANISVFTVGEDADIVEALLFETYNRVSFTPSPPFFDCFPVVIHDLLPTHLAAIKQEFADLEDEDFLLLKICLTIVDMWELTYISGLFMFENDCYSPSGDIQFMPWEPLEINVCDR